MSSNLLHSEGWEARVDARLIRSTDAWEDATEFRSHGHILRRLLADQEHDGLEIDAVLCIDNRPTLCVKDSRQLAPPKIEELRRQLWNLGATTLLVVETQHDVEVFSTIAKPLQDDQQGLGAQLTNDTIGSLEATALALQLQRLIRRVETGAIYREYRSQFNPKGSVNRYLLNNLREARNIIAREHSKEAYKRTHAFIGRFLFSCYLLDRGIVGPPYLKKTNLPEANDMLQLLAESERGPETLKTLFTALQRDFNGSLFGDLVDDFDIRDAEVICLRRFLSGEDLRTGQPSFFKLYDFSFIPVELISSIYEEFLGAEAAAEKATSQQGRSRANGQRTQGAYYTPPRLAELAVDIATEGWETLLDKHCLDPACGSGLFLVILFIRMAEEWRKRNPNADTRLRYESLMRLLSENLSGIDIHPTACLVTCFSLYLAFLDQMEPKEIIQLREALEHDPHRKILRRILWQRDAPRPRPPHVATVQEVDFFEKVAQREFDLVIGNPPWVSRRPALSAESWLFAPLTNPVAIDITKSARRQVLFPAREMACAFMWKAGLHLRPEGRVCQVLPSRVFLSNNTDRFQSLWLQHHKLDTLWLFADWSFVLFRNADCPCFIVRYHPRGDEELSTFEFVTPKVSSLDPREGLIPVLPEDQKTLSQPDLLSAAKNGQAAAAWKERHWGTPRDHRLIDRLMRLPRLSGIATRPPRMKRDTPGTRRSHNKKRWWAGQGFQPLTDSDKSKEGYAENSWPIWWETSHPFLSADIPLQTLILDVPKGYGRREEFLRRTVAPELCRPPLVVVNKALTKASFSDHPIVFQDDFQAFAGPDDDDELLLFLTAYLNTDLAQYLIFHTSANIGIERDIVRLEEILSLPFPLPKDTRDPERREEIIASCAQMLRQQYNAHGEAVLHSQDSFDATRRESTKLVHEYFDICEWERHLIEDTVKIFRPSSTPGSLDSTKLITVQPSTGAHRKTYAETLIKTFRGWTRTGKHLWAEGSVADRLGLAFITFGIADRAKKYEESLAEKRVSRLLDDIRSATSEDWGVIFHRLRGFVYYERNRVHILKPLNRRHWTRTAALNDADEILTHMMEEDGWGA